MVGVSRPLLSVLHSMACFIARVLHGLAEASVPISCHLGPLHLTQIFARRAHLSAQCHCLIPSGSTSAWDCFVELR